MKRSAQIEWPFRLVESSKCTGHDLNRRTKFRRKHGVN